MADLLSRLKKRRCYPVDLGDGQIVHVRALTIGELRRNELLEKDLKTPFVMAAAIVEENGEQQFKPNADESDSDFAKRVMEDLADVSTETISLISQAVAKIGKIPDVAVTAKN